MEIQFKNGAVRDVKDKLANLLIDKKICTLPSDAPKTEGKKGKTKGKK
jgi:hypothetical protein